ncbi:MAG: chromate transporter, partial [Eubacteriales bacterium]|nr:chromate transporter [Eubacteriales bacterium]
MIYLELFIEFLKIGLFSVGGGLATLPFLNSLIETKGWYTAGELTNMLAISESTPGPIGVNMATYVGFHTGGIFGSLIATFGLVLPSYIIIIIVAHFLQKFSENKYVEGV